MDWLIEWELVKKNRSMRFCLDNQMLIIYPGQIKHAYGVKIWSLERTEKAPFV
jgi:hypothetical protein